MSNTDMLISHCLQPVIAFNDIVHEMSEGSDMHAPGESGLLGLSSCVALVLGLCVDEARRRLGEALDEARETGLLVPAGKEARP